MVGMRLWSQENAVRCDTGSFADVRDNQIYKWVKIGTQAWMAQNLNYEMSKGSSCYNNDSAFCRIYGRLYEWSTALKACPAGWHLPAHAEWTVLSDYLEDQAGEKLKESGTKHWNGPDAVVRGDSGFNALPAGSLSVDEMGRPHHGGLGYFAYFWAATTATPASKGWARYLNYLDDEVHRVETWKIFGYSVRCVRNQ